MAFSTPSTQNDAYRLWPAYYRLWRNWVRQYWRPLTLGFVMIALNALANGAMVRVTVWLVDAFEAQDVPTIQLAPFVVVGVAIIRALTQYGWVLLANTALSKAEADMQRDMHRALIHADLAHMQAEPPAALAARFNADIALIRTVMLGVFAGFAYIATIIAAFTQMLLIDWSMTLGLLAIFGLAMAPISAIGQRLKGLSMRTQEEIATMTAQINEGLSGARLAKTYRLEDYLQQSAEGRFNHLRRLKVKAADWQARVEPMMEALGGFAMAALIAFVGYRIGSGASSVAEFSGFLAGLAIAMQPMRKLGSIYAQLSMGYAALARVYGLLDRENTVTDRIGAEPLPVAKGQITFDSVGFAYPDGTRALSDFSLTIAAGMSVALVGRSGAGKSSVFNLIPRLYDVTEGAVRIDGHDLRDVTLASLRDQIAMVSQDSVLFTDSVAANIAFGREGVSREEIETAARDASAHDFITALPQGYDTQIDEEGGSFSGGERQRLSIARAIIRNAPILLLDEPTSALDAESEAAIRAALRRMGAGRTRIIIAHRLATILDSDMIVAMDAGRIIEAGTHEELLARNGLYADLYRLQFRN